MERPKQMTTEGQATALPRNSTLAQQIAKRTEDAYSADRYYNWPDCAATILDLGYTERETEAILRSKWMRWAADVNGADYGKVPAKAIEHALRNPEVLFGDREAGKFQCKLDELVLATFGGQA